MVFDLFGYFPLYGWQIKVLELDVHYSTRDLVECHIPGLYVHMYVCIHVCIYAVCMSKSTFTFNKARVLVGTIVLHFVSPLAPVSDIFPH